MKYVWILILLVIDVFWLISSIVDIVKTVRFVKKHRQYGSISDFIICMKEELEEPTLWFIALHILALFTISFSTWMNFKIGSDAE